jgi:hypothetical protein
MTNMDTKNCTISGKSQPVGPQFTNGWFEYAFMGLVK